jgi:hypothetical protein
MSKTELPKTLLAATRYFADPDVCGAVPCKRPDRSGLALLVGDQSIIEGNN